MIGRHENNPDYDAGAANGSGGGGGAVFVNTVGQCCGFGDGVTVSGGCNIRSVGFCAGIFSSGGGENNGTGSGCGTALGEGDLQACGTDNLHF